MDGDTAANEAAPVEVLASRRHKRLGKRVPRGTPFRRIQRNALGLTLGPRFFRAWLHPTKGHRKQVISFKEASVLIASGAFVPRKDTQTLELDAAAAA